VADGPFISAIDPVNASVEVRELGILSEHLQDLRISLAIATSQNSRAITQVERIRALLETNPHSNPARETQ